MKTGLTRSLRSLVHRLWPELAQLSTDLQGVRSHLETLAPQVTLTKTHSFTDQPAQTQLWLHYQLLMHQGLPLPRFADTGFRVYSQSDEDGLLLYIFALIGTTNRRCVDLAFGQPHGANTTNLICNWGWTGLLLEGNPHLAALSREFFATHPDTLLYPPQIIQEWITAENINSILAEAGFSGEIDLFCLDLDGVDFWIWKSLEAVQPRVVVVEYQDIWGDRAVTVPYQPHFDRLAVHPDYCGASLPAFVKLAHQKGYRLVGCNRYGFNAFFVRQDVSPRLLPEVAIADCLCHPKVLDGQRHRLPQVADYEWVEI